MKTLFQRHYSDMTVKLLEWDLLPTHASLPKQTYIALLLVTTDQDHTVVPLEPNSILRVGRSIDSSLVLKHPTVSSEHVLIYSVMTAPDPSNSLVFCQDLESENGTYINSRRIPRGEAILLQHGDCLEIRHAAKIHLIQDNITRSNVDKAIGVALNPLLKTFYIHRRLVGQGGHAKIFLATHRQSGYLAACKIVRIHQPEITYLEYATREVHLLAELSHPNIIEMFSAIQTPTSVIIFEPLQCGGDLHNFIFELHQDGLDEFNGKFIIFQLLKAIEYLHSNGIAHRDLKMENILLQYPTLPALIKITDFGFARHVPCPPERMNLFCGSLEFLAPEMIRTLPEVPSLGRKGYGKEIDIWGVGVISFAVLSGELPFYETENVTKHDIMRSILWKGLSFNKNWDLKSVHAISFVKKLLCKIPSCRPTASEALESYFLQLDKSDLEILYHKLVLSSWRRREGRDCVIIKSVDTEQESQEERQSEMDESVEVAASLGVLSEIDLNIVEAKERKRPYPDGKENDSPNLEDDGAVRKRRKQLSD